MGLLFTLNQSVFSNILNCAFTQCLEIVFHQQLTILEDSLHHIIRVITVGIQVIHIAIAIVYNFYTSALAFLFTVGFRCFEHDVLISINRNRSTFNSKPQYIPGDILVSVPANTKHHV